MEHVTGSIDSATSGAAMRAPHVLIIDDDALIRALARAVLEKAGMTVTEAEQGESALEHLERGVQFDLALLDLDMPTMSGADVLAAIRANPATARLPVVVLSGSEAEQDEIRLAEAGADDYVRKPIVPDRLLSRIKSALGRAGS